MNEKTRRLCISGLMMAAYIVAVYFTQPFSFGQYQIRIATALYSFAYIFDYLCLPLALANMLANLWLGSLGLLDILGGFLIGLITTKLICYLKKINRSSLFCCLPIAVAPTVIVPIWLHVILQVKYGVLVLLMIPGQVISALTAGMIIIPVARLLSSLERT